MGTVEFDKHGYIHITPSLSLSVDTVAAADPLRFKPNPGSLVPKVCYY